jgi:hypothetical protein
MSTFSQLIDQTLMHLYGYTTIQDQATYLSAGVSASATTLQIADTTAISRGVVEIGDELIWVDDVNTSTGGLTVPPYGRGFRGTTAISHASGTRVVSSPLFPRKIVRDTLNDAIRSVYPELFAVGETTFTFNSAITTYALPAGALDVLSVAWQTTGPTLEWMPVRRMRVDKHAATGSFSSGVTLNIYDSIVPGRTIKVVFTKEPSALVNDADEFTTVTGLPRSCEDLIRLGASYRLVPFFDSPHLSGSSAEADFSSQQRGIGSSAQLSRFLLQMYQVRLQEEQKGLQTLYPVRSYYTR